jgi:uridylate kinase
MENNKHIIISLGGSLIVPNAIDAAFIKSFTELIKEFIAKGFKFVIITGGGKVSRNYTDTLKEISVPSNTDLDWVGIAATRLNAELVRVAFSDLAYADVVRDPDHMPQTDKPVIMSAGWKPGNSSDMAAINAAASLGAKRVINLSNIDYAYDKDPNKFSDAIKIEQSSWAEFRKILPSEWEPGLNTPFDPIAAAQAESLGLEVVIMNGKNLTNLASYLNGEAFQGTVIR